MSSRIDYHIVDAFATGPFTGNQAAVVVTQTALQSDIMQKIAAFVSVISLNSLVSHSLGI
jgi:predicted PhzF superfamily epimerase YddE/YHI9